jgi:hypothetical protein
MPTTLAEQIRKAWARLRGRAPDYSGAKAPWDEQEPPPGGPEEDALVFTFQPLLQGLIEFAVVVAVVLVVQRRSRPS